jgi:hypothetical protein
MASRKPAELLKDSRGYRLAGPLRQRFDSQFGNAPRSIVVTKLIVDLPAKVPGIQERAFLQEVIACYRVEAFRSAIVMCWNLAFDHLLRWVLIDHTRLSSFNAAISRRFPKSTASITCFDDFERLKEYEIVEICVTANLVSSSIGKILREKLGKRNVAAHPSAVEITRFQVEDVITDLVNNVVLRLT